MDSGSKNRMKMRIKHYMRWKIKPQSKVQVKGDYIESIKSIRLIHDEQTPSGRITYS